MHVILNMMMKIVGNEKLVIVFSSLILKLYEVSDQYSTSWPEIPLSGGIISLNFCEMNNSVVEIIIISLCKNNFVLDCISPCVLKNSLPTSAITCDVVLLKYSVFPEI